MTARADDRDGSAGTTPDGAPVLINKRELAKLIGVSLPTVGALIERYPDLPIARRGTNGVEWQFDGPAVVTFLRGRQAEEAASRTARDELLAQLVLPLDPQDPPATNVISVKDQLDALKLRAELRKEAEAAGKLVVAADVEAQFTAVMIKFRSQMRAFIQRLGRSQQWPDDVTRQVEKDLEDLQNRLVDEAGDTGNEEANPDVRQRAFV